MEAQTVLANPIPRAQFCLSNCKLDGELNPPLWKREKHRGSCPCKTLPVSGAHRGLINEVFKRVAITPQPRRAASFCSTNWSTGAVLTLPLAGLAWELQHPKPGTFWAGCAANPICCPGREQDPLEGSLREPREVLSHLPSHQGTLTELPGGDRHSPCASAQAERNVLWLQALTPSP